MPQICCSTRFQCFLLITGRLKGELDSYIATQFPVGLVKMVRMKERVGLIRARMEGVRQASGEVIVIFDSHMEVNVQWSDTWRVCVCVCVCV